jgi:CxxC-x17-CxxC domain-containing protein
MDLYKAKYSDKKFNRHSKTNHYNNGKFLNDKVSQSFRNSKSKTSPQNRYSGYRKNQEMFTAICTDCKTECKIPFEPKLNQSIYCSICFQKNKKDLTNRNPQDQPVLKINHDNLRNNRSLNNKFLKKREHFYSNGSEKFYSSLKEKLFEILGGKFCSSCGFKDERALGFNHINDKDAFDNIRRGGFASSWGKYISEPELARLNLQVLCLNCNEIRQSEAKSKPKNSISKSRYLPRR